MKLIKVGSFYCEFCKKELPALVNAQDPELVMEYKDEAIGMIKNFHWYDTHYNCAICSKWIQSGERELVLKKEFKGEISGNYNADTRDGLLRVHKSCLELFNSP